MSTYLLTISLGPVQSLIEAARRTRDLWCGSWLLSEAARAGALTLYRAPECSLIFPCPDDPEQELQPRDALQDDPKAIANISNILRARVEADSPKAVAALCAATTRAARERLAALCARAKGEVRGLPFHEDLWEAQRRDILESYAAWTQMQGADYTGAARQLARLLAARKATREFSPAGQAPDGMGYGVPKSSLDGARESVINVIRREREASRYRTAFRKLGLAPGEQLDALAIAKRRAGNPEQFTAYSRLAADPWIRTLTPEQQGRIRAAYEPLIALELATRVRGNQGAYAPLPYDAQLLYDFRLANALRATDTSDDDTAALGRLERVLKAIRNEQDADGRAVDAPVPYAVILKADGDRMGKLLSQAKQIGDSQRISKALHRFAAAVPGIVREHQGHAIYSGGDDVLALLPLAGAVECADALRLAFAHAMTDSARALGLDEEQWPTLSVGLGIGHLMEPLGSLRARADAAEQAAKGSDLPEAEQRNALAIVLGIRSGADCHWRAQWVDEPARDALARFIHAYRDSALPSRVAYDLREIGRRFAWLDAQVAAGSADAATAQGMRGSEVARMLERARNQGGAGTIPADLRALILDRSTAESLDHLANALIMARWLAARTAADLGESE